jgi:hypothetical protein
MYKHTRSSATRHLWQASSYCTCPLTPGAGLQKAPLSATAKHCLTLTAVTKDSVNKRTDEYGGSIENRCRVGVPACICQATDGTHCAADINPMS